MPATLAAPHPIAPPTRPKVPVASPPSLRSPTPYPATDPPIDQLRPTASQSLSVQQAFCAAAHTAPAATGRSMKRPRQPCARHPLFWHLVQLPLPPTRASRRRSIADAAAPRKISLPEPHQPRSHSANPNACTVANFSGYDALGQMHLPGRVRWNAILFENGDFLPACLGGRRFARLITDSLVSLAVSCPCVLARRGSGPVV